MKRFTYLCAVTLTLSMMLPSLSYADTSMADVIKMLVQSGVISSADALKAGSAVGQAAPATVPAASSVQSISTGCYVFSKNFGIGTKSDDVLHLKDILIKSGYLSSRGTNEYGPVTAGIVKKFQKKHGIEASGYVGVLTRAKLNSLCAPVPVSSTPLVLPPVAVVVPTPSATPTPTPVVSGNTNSANAVEAYIQPGTVISPKRGTVVLTDNTLTVEFMPVPGVPNYISLVEDTSGRAVDLTNLLGYNYIPDNSKQKLTFKIPDSLQLTLDTPYRIEICAKVCTKGQLFDLMKSYTAFSMYPVYFASSYRLNDSVNVPLYINATGTARFAGVTWKAVGNVPRGVSMVQSGGAGASLQGRVMSTGHYSFKVQAADNGEGRGFAEATVVMEVSDN